MESFWAEMATRKHKVKQFIFLCFHLAAVAWLFCLSHVYIVMHFPNFAYFYLNCVNGSTYSILTVLISKKIKVCFSIVFLMHFP